MSEEQKPPILYRNWKEEDFPIVKEYYVQLDTHFRSLGLLLPEVEDVSQVWLESFQRILGKFAMMYIAEMEGEIVGFILTRMKQLPKYWGGVMVGHMSDMYIHKKARRRGVGKELSRLTVAWLKEQGVHSIEIQVLPENDPSWNLFDEFGFKQEFKAARLTWDNYNEPDPPEDALYDIS